MVEFVIVALLFTVVVFIAVTFCIPSVVNRFPVMSLVAGCNAVVLAISVADDVAWRLKSELLVGEEVPTTLAFPPAKKDRPAMQLGIH